MCSNYSYSQAMHAQTYTQSLKYNTWTDGQYVNKCFAICKIVQPFYVIFNDDITTISSLSPKILP